MATTYATFYKGETIAVDYTPGSAVTGGDVVVIGANVYFAKLDIAANVLGALEIGGQWQLPKETGTAHSQGDRVYWDATNHRVTKTAGSNQLIGVAAADAASAATSGYYLSIPNSTAVIST